MEGYVLTNFDVHNIVFVGDDLRFTGIGFLRVKKDDNSFQQKRKSNFECIHRLQLGIFSGVAKPPGLVALKRMQDSLDYSW